MGLQPGAFFPVTGAVQLHHRTLGQGGSRFGPALRAGEGAADAGLFVQHRAGVGAAVGGGGGEGAGAGHGDGAVLRLFPAALVTLDAGVLGVVVPGQQEAAVLVQGDVGFQPGAFLPVAGAVQLQEHILRRGGLGNRSRLGSGLRGRLGRRRDRRAGNRGCKEAGPADEGGHNSQQGHDAQLDRQFQLFAPQQHQHQGGHYGHIQNSQQNDPVGAGVGGHVDGDAVGLGVQDVVAGLTHGLLRGVGAGVQRDAHQAKHHVAAGADGQVRVHPLGVAHGGVGDDGTLKAPLAAQHIGKQCAAGAGPGVTQVAVAGHDGGGAALLDRQLKGFEVNFADGLFVGPHRQSQTVGLLVVQCEVLDVSIHALAHAAPHLGGGQLAGEQRVLGIVLKVAPAEGGAVDVGAGGIEARQMVSGSLRAQGLAKTLHQFLVPGSADEGLGGETHALEVAGQAVDAGRAVQLGGGGLAHTVHRRGGPAAVGDHVGHVLHAQLFQQLLPFGIVVIKAGHILQGEAVVRHGDGLVALVHRILRRAGEAGGQLGAGGLLFRAGGGQGALPVGPGHILGDLALFHILKPVEGGGLVPRAGVALAVGHGAVHGVFPAVDDFVGIGHQLDLVAARVQHVAARARRVIRGHVRNGKLHRDRLALARLQQVRLAEAGQHHMALFDAAGGVGGGVVDLHHILAGHIAGVGHLHLHADGVLIGGVVRDGLFKGGVAQTVAEGILHRGLVSGLVAFAGGVVDPAGLVEAVAHIDALGILKVIAAFQVGVGENACVPEGGRGGQVIGPGVCETAGGSDLPRQHLAHRVHAGGAGRADPQGGVHAVLLQKAGLHGVGGVQQHDDLFKVLGLHQGQQVLFVLGEFQIVAAVVCLAVTGGIHILGQIVALAAGAGEHHHRHVGIRPCAVQQLLAVLAGGHLGGGEVRPAEAGGHRAAHPGVFIKVHQVLVHRKARLGETLHQVHVAGVVAGAAARAAVDRVDGGVAEEVDGLAALQGQSAVFVFQQHDTLALQLLSHLLAGLLGLVRRERQAVDADVLRARQPGVQIGGHEGVDGGKEDAAGDVGSQHHRGEQGQRDNGSPPFFLFLFHCLLLSLAMFPCAGTARPAFRPHSIIRKADRRVYLYQAIYDKIRQSQRKESPDGTF